MLYHSAAGDGDEDEADTVLHRVFQGIVFLTWKERRFQRWFNYKPKEDQVVNGNQV